MPRVPLYDGGRVTTRAMPGAQLQQISPDAFGAGLGQDIQRAAATVQGQVQGPEWDRANQAKIDDATTKLAQKRIELGDRLKQAQGDQALHPDFASGLEQEFKSASEEVAQGLVNPAQRDAFGRESTRLGLGLQESISSHVIAQSELVSRQKADARMQTMVQSAIANRGDEGLAWQDIMDAQAAHETYTKSIGVPIEARDAEQAQLRSKATADIISAFADDGNHVAAQKWLEGYRAQLKDPADLARAERATKGATIRGESQSAVDKILAMTGADGRPIGIQDALAQAAKVQNPELRAAIEERAVSMLNLREKAHEDDQTNQFADAYKIAKDDPRGIDAVPLSTLQGLDPKYREQLQAWATRQAKGVPLPWQVSKAVRYQIEAQAATPEGRQKFVDSDLRQLLTSVNKEDFDALAGLQQEIRKTGADGSDAGWLTTREEMVNQALAGMKIDPKTYRTKDDGTTTPNEAAINFRAAVELEANTMAGAAKRQKPTIDDVRKAIDNVMLRKVRYDETGRNTTDFVGSTLTRDQRKTAFVPIDQISGGQAQAVRDLIHGAGGDPTDDRVQRAYAARLMNDRALFDQIIRER
jgi:hypothetical protein